MFDPLETTGPQCLNVFSLLETLEELFPDKLPTSAQLRQEPEIVWLRIGEQRVIRKIYELINKRRE